MHFRYGMLLLSVLLWVWVWVFTKGGKSESWNPGIRWNLTESHGSMESDGIQWNPMEYDGIQWNLMKSQGIMELDGMSRNPTQLLNPMKSYRTFEPSVRKPLEVVLLQKNLFKYISN